MKGTTYQLINSAYYNYINIYFVKIIRTAPLLITFCLALLPAYSQNNADIQLANEYVLKGDKKKAIELYKDLSKNDANIPLIHNNYLNVLLDAGAFDEAQNYLKKVLKRDPQNIQYR